MAGGDTWRVTRGDAYRHGESDGSETVYTRQRKPSAWNVAETRCAGLPACSVVLVVCLGSVDLRVRLVKKGGLPVFRVMVCLGSSS